MRYSNSQSVKVNTTIYNKFKGADFSTDPSQVDESRSPMPLNLVADEGGFPEKRLGWRTVYQFAGQINGIFTLTVQDETYLFVHHGSKISRYNEKTGEATEIKTDVTDHRSMGFVMRGALYLLTGGEYLVITVDNGEITCKNVSENAYVPTTVISRDPKGGGYTFEPVNLIGKQRINSFLANQTDKYYQLDSENIESVDKVIVNGKEMTEEAGDFTIEYEKGQVRFKEVPPTPEDIGGVSGADNVFITYSKTVEDYAERITQCTICEQYGRGSFDRVFFSGNPKHKNLDWYCGYNDPTYIPDLSYSVVGSEETAIMGYLRIGAQLIIVKEDNQQDATVFVRSVEVDENGSVNFPLQQGVQSIGAVSKYCLSSLRDDPLFLSRYGVNAIVTNNITLERTVRRRSGLVDPKLTKESGLENAYGCVWGDWYVIAINNKCYVADSKQKSYKGSLADNFMYEWYYWDNIPARVLFEHDNTLMFGTASGGLCRFNNDIDGVTKYSDDGTAIVAEWATKADDDGDFMRYKTMIRRGSGVQCKPYSSGSVKVLVRTEKDFGYEIKTDTMSFFNFNDINFNSFSFNTMDTPQIVPLNQKVRKYKTMQIIVRNEGANEGFGVFQIIKRYRVMNYVK